LTDQSLSTAYTSFDVLLAVVCVTTDKIQVAIATFFVHDVQRTRVGLRVLHYVADDHLRKRIEIIIICTQNVYKPGQAFMAQLRCFSSADIFRIWSRKLTHDEARALSSSSPSNRMAVSRIFALILPLNAYAN